MSRKEARWLYLLSQLNTSRLSLKSGNIHVLGDVLLWVPNIINEDLTSVNQIKVATVTMDVNLDYTGDHMFEPILLFLRGDFPKNAVQLERVKRRISLFMEREGLLIFEGKVCVPKKYISNILQSV